MLLNFVIVCLYVHVTYSRPYSFPDCIVSSGSPPTRDKLRCEEKVRARRDWRNERLRDIATALTDRSPESSLALPAEGLLNLKKVRFLFSQNWYDTQSLLLSVP